MPRLYAALLCGGLMAGQAQAETQVDPAPTDTPSATVGTPPEGGESAPIPAEKPSSFSRPGRTGRNLSGRGTAAPPQTPAAPIPLVPPTTEPRKQEAPAAITPDKPVEIAKPVAAPPSPEDAFRHENEQRRRRMEQMQEQAEKAEKERRERRLKEMQQQHEDAVRKN